MDHDLRNHLFSISSDLDHLRRDRHHDHAVAAVIRPGQIGRAKRGRSRGRCLICCQPTLPGQFIGRVKVGDPNEVGRWVHVACVTDPPDGTQGELWPPSSCM